MTACSVLTFLMVWPRSVFNQKLSKSLPEKTIFLILTWHGTVLDDYKVIFFF